MAEKQEPEVIEIAQEEAGSMVTVATYIGGFALATQVAGSLVKTFIPSVDGWAAGTLWKEAIVDAGAGLIPAALGIALLGGGDKKTMTGIAILAGAGVLVGTLIPRAEEVSDAVVNFVAGLFGRSGVTRALPAASRLQLMQGGAMALPAAAIGNDVGSPLRDIDVASGDFIG